MFNRRFATAIFEMKGPHEIQVQNNLVDAHVITFSMYHRVSPASWMASLFNSRDQRLQGSDAKTANMGGNETETEPLIAQP